MEQMESAAHIKMATEAHEEDGRFVPGKVKSASVRIGGREIPLRYDMRVQLQVEEELGTDFYELQNKLNKDKKSTKTVIGAIRILGNEGLKAAGETPDLTDDWLMDNMVPAQIINYRLAAMAALVAGWYMETDNSYEEKQDVVLNEIRKKNENTESPTGRQSATD